MASQDLHSWMSSSVLKLAPRRGADCDSGTSFVDGEPGMLVWVVGRLGVARCGFKDRFVGARDEGKVGGRAVYPIAKCKEKRSVSIPIPNYLDDKRIDLGQRSFTSV